MSASDEGLVVGSWTLWSVAMVTVICRLVSRRMVFGSFRKYQLDDYLMMIATIAYTGVVVSSNQVATNGSNYVADEVIAAMTPKEREQAIWGSKMLLALEQFSLAAIWLVKACLLLLYARMTAGLNEGIAVKVLAVYCAVGYVVIQILYLGVWCRPIYYYWALPVPTSHPQCKSYHNHMITVTTFNISSDLAMLCIPVPLIARAHLPLKRKLVLCIVFSLGVFVVLVAILNRYYNFSTTNSLVFLSWYNGEASTAIMIANIPFCWTLLRWVFSLDAWGTSKRSRINTGPPTIGDARRYGRRPQNSDFLGLDTHASMEVIAGRDVQASQVELGVLERAETEGSSRSKGSDPESVIDRDKISITKTVAIHQNWEDR